MEEEKSSLARGLKGRHVQLIALGGIIGSGYFLGTGYVIGQAGPAATLAYLFGGLIVISVMMCLGELASARPVAGSFIAYAKEFISPAWACGVGWSYWLTWVTYVPSEMIAAGIIMHNFFPEIGALWWSILFGLAITIINLMHVKSFGETEFWLAIIKISALILFVGLAIGIMLGLIGSPTVLGTNMLFDSGGFSPKGSWAILFTMVIVLVNFQGAEIIGLAAAESDNPAKAIPRTIKQVSWRIISIYILPLLLLLCIYPWEKASLEESVFSAALNYYGLEWAGAIFSFVILTAAISCSNSGIYACSRALHALAIQGMAPKKFSVLNKNGVPYVATIASIFTCWIGILFYHYDTSESVYTYLLALSGFTGAITWISICWCQLRYRNAINNKTLINEPTLSFRTPLFPYVTHFGIWSQIICLCILAFSEDLRISFYVGIPLLIIPISCYMLKQRILHPANHLTSKL